MKKTEWIAKAKTSKGWIELRRFDNPGDADKWLTGFIKENRYCPEDFTIRREER